jgi:hypothetical protein
MKRIPAILTAILVAAFFSVSAQTSTKMFNAHSEFSKTSADALPLSTESKAYKNFRRAYPNVVNEKWSQQNDHYIASFVLNDVKNKVVYTKFGKLDYFLKMYTEKELPAFVRKAVKSAYYDYSITNAQELHTSTQTIFLVKITDRNSWKTIRVSDGEMEEIENYYSVISPCR